MADSDLKGSAFDSLDEAAAANDRYFVLDVSDTSGDNAGAGGQLKQQSPLYLKETLGVLSLAAYNAWTSAQYSPRETITFHASTMDWDTTASQNAKITLTANVTDFTVGTLIGDGGYCSLRIFQGGSGSYTFVWGGEITWLGGTPTLSTGVGEFDEFIFSSDGSQLYGSQNPFPSKSTIWVPAAAMRPTVSNGCAALADVETTAARPDMTVLDFDNGDDEHAQFQVAFPESWDEDTVTFRVFWTSTAADTDGVAWAVQGVAVGDGNTIDVVYGTPIVVTDDAQSTAEDLYVTAESAAVTISGSPAVDELCFFRVFRDVSDGNDDMTEDARLLGIKLFYTTEAPSDE